MVENGYIIERNEDEEKSFIVIEEQEPKNYKENTNKEQLIAFEKLIYELMRLFEIYITKYDKYTININVRKNKNYVKDD